MNLVVPAAHHPRMSETQNGFCLLRHDKGAGDSSSSFVFAPCACRVCLRCAQKSLEDQVQPQLQLLCQNRIPTHENSNSRGASSTAVTASRNELHLQLFLSCPLCGRDVDTSSALHLANESLLIWKALTSPHSLPGEPENDTCSEKPKTITKTGEPSSSRSIPETADCRLCSESLPANVAFRLEPCLCCFCLFCAQALLTSQLEAKIETQKNNGKKDMENSNSEVCSLDCPGCGGPVPLSSVSNILPEMGVPSREGYPKTEDQSTEEHLSQFDLQPCPSCGFLTLRESSSHTTTSTQTDRASSSGNDEEASVPASLLAQIQHWFCCPACKSTYCGNCHAFPYHTERTCLEHEELLRSPPCRFCGERIPPRNPNSAAENLMWHGDGAKTLKHVCGERECQEKARLSCTKTHAQCGHPCGGVRGERRCLPCLKEGCYNAPGPSSRKALPSCKDECPICVAEALDLSPSILLSCGHVVHASCAREMVERRYPGPEVSLRFLECPVCSAVMEHEYLEGVMREGLALRRKVFELIEERLNQESRGGPSPPGEERRVAREDLFRRCLLFECAKCKKLYVGGDRECGNGAEEQHKEKEYVCQECSYGEWNGQSVCTKGHGSNYIQYKCRYCCSPSSFFCFGTTHFCNKCHTQFVNRGGVVSLQACTGGPRCPLKVSRHPPAGTEFVLGCGLCRTGK